MKLTLKINEKDKSFTSPFISTRVLRKTIEIQKTRNLNDFTPELLDEMVDFLVEVYGNKFTADEFYDGHESSKTMPTITDTINYIITGAADSTKDLQDPNE